MKHSSLQKLAVIQGREARRGWAEAEGQHRAGRPSEVVAASVGWINGGMSVQPHGEARAHSPLGVQWVDAWYLSPSCGR